MAERHPLVHVVVVDATTTSLVPQVVADSLDLAVVNVPVAASELATEPLFDEERIVLARTSHPLAARERATLADLADPLLLEPRGTAFRDELDDEMARSGLTVRPQAEIDGIRLLTSLAFEGFGRGRPRRRPPLVRADCRRVQVEGLAPGRWAWPLRRGRLSAPAARCAPPSATWWPAPTTRASTSR